MPATRPAHADIALRNRCTRWLNGHRPQRSMRESLMALAELPEAALALDVYGEGEALQALEADVAALLGKPAARFFHKGVAAQLAALRVHGGAGDGPVALHPQSHIAIDEAEAFEALMGLRGLRIGEPDRPFGVEALAALPERPAVVVVELPLRRGGYRLPAWEELAGISRWCREAGVPLHVDGARLWEAAAHYGRPLADIAALADSVYVSFYKGLGGLAGCVLAGSESFIAATAPWQTRLAGNVYTQYPVVLAARDGLRRQLPRMADYRERARQLAALLVGEPGWRVAPEPPQVNAFQLHLPAGPAALREGLLAVARDQGFWLGARAVASTVLDGGAMVEIVIGDAADGWADAQALQAVRDAVAVSRR
ncbi:threonine aldolase family protein [Roseateles cellulosilyticus]|uniref:Beta-eliminating lyase-related protein n=1 Tax=Pelomonas cellulosilytica TaxID=2906762 RepID=A0ABS8XLW1_9BURK|nr:beta-eliminating lyase-related protein [Pelomonas sp. P8]MCE4553781.1 beta-eliminating lyase-related protein [Pelomonas sp. P8]